jgi:para-aminobenzoate synthetase/4-amino-4-deoxychorismate lyase
VSRDFQLYEALLWESPGGYFLLEYHLQRLERSAAHFRFALDVGAARRQLARYAQQLPEPPRKVRLELAASGAIVLTNEAVKPSTPVVVALSSEPVQSDDEFLRHKTTRRAVFDRALAAHPEAQDVLLWNERRELTESCHANVVLEIEGRRLTPPLSSGLQPGVFRAYLLDRGEIHEETLRVESIEAASAVFLINSVRRWFEGRVIREGGRGPRPAGRRVTGRYRITTGDSRSTEELVEAGRYGYAHSCLISENFPARRFAGRRVREVVLLEFDRGVTSEEAVAGAAEEGLERPVYEDALYFGIEHPDVQRERPVVFLHDPWFGHFGRRDVLCLWSNAGRRELGLEGFDDRWSATHRFAFVRERSEAGPGADR